MDTSGTARSAPHPTPASLIRKWFDEVWNAGRAESIDELFPAHAVMWGAGRPEIPSEGPAEFKKFYHAMRAACPDIHVTLEKVVEEGDTAFGRWTATLTHTGEGLGIAPTGRALKVCGMSALRVQGGEIVEGWNNWDQIGLARQLGILGGQAAELFG
ncbi:MAG: ester cyclase [Candidatus Acidiferrum sp.]|jgi:predicted ester cyclase